METTIDQDKIIAEIQSYFEIFSSESEPTLFSDYLLFISCFEFKLYSMNVNNPA